jgi:hypothetical protein
VVHPDIKLPLCDIEAGDLRSCLWRAVNTSFGPAIFLDRLFLSIISQPAVMLVVPKIRHQHR